VESVGEKIDVLISTLSEGYNGKVVHNGKMVYNGEMVHIMSKSIESDHRKDVLHFGMNGSVFICT
jgi:hypothetical protein